MLVVRTVKEMREARVGAKGVGLVPTMGALHAGHVSLLRAARSRCNLVIASIFVNPLQFGAGEDFDRYPRTLEEDARVLEREGVDVMFVPSALEMYPQSQSTFVQVTGLEDRLDGVSRPGHFRGVATVVTKLFNIVTPDQAFFGQKDAAQVAVLRQMVLDLSMAVEIVVCPTVREADGLAMSSRNGYLTAEERRRAVALSRGLRAAEVLFEGGMRDADELQRAMQKELAAEAGVQVEYAAVVDERTLAPVAEAASGTLFAVAARVGTTRLIDNVRIGAGGAAWTPERE